METSVTETSDLLNELDAEHCPDCGSNEAGSCFYCKMD